MLINLIFELLLLFAAAAAAQPELTPPLPHQLTKRMDLESCIGHFDIHKNTIIRTGESQAIGGKYLQGLELDTLEECERLCCETDSCDVYIFERKTGGYCYLFECGPPENFHCKFTRHANYTSAVLTSQLRHNAEVASTPRPQLPHIPSNNISQQEWELSNLKTKQEKPAAAAAVAAALPTQAAAVGVAVVAAAAQNAVPSAHCGRFQFSCHSGECIAVYNACDGIPQCEDGSDEGPECNAIAPTATKLNNNNNNLNAEQYQQQQQQQLLPATQQQQQQQHVVVLGPPPQPPPPPPPQVVNNREDAAAWLNRKAIAETQAQQQQQLRPQLQGDVAITAEQQNSRIFNHKGGLQLQQQQQQQGQLQLPAYGNNNNAAAAAATLYGMSLPGTNIYLTPQQQPVAVASVPQQQQPAWPQVAAPPAAHGYIAAAPASPVAAAAAAPQQSMLPVLNAAPQPGKQQAAVDEYDYDDEEKSTEAPKKKTRKHKKFKSQDNKDANVLALEQTKQQLPQLHPTLPVPVGPVHEQYKIIHENLALEFRDHDGQAERPGGAVLSLTLGLLVTAALSILIGCRMRTVGRRARRLGGKTPYSQEADFLVNGMYL
ncbi:CG6495 [Drosophila busckii]|uniref:CG6495 n=1 Tax=Drosophila busckii TaxID=30019 RepID=A0A0M4EEP6_DROBS|nr:low-density lipoprotein receptor-related protein 11 [Drosophila busckii]ALC38680.1 CG6495 [Drosophila busckii]